MSWARQLCGQSRVQAPSFPCWGLGRVLSRVASCKRVCGIFDAIFKLLAGSCRSAICISGFDIDSPVFHPQMCIEAYRLLVTCKRLHDKNPIYLSAAEAAEAEATPPVTIRSDAPETATGELRELLLVPESEPNAEEEPMPQHLLVEPVAEPQAEPGVTATGGVIAGGAAEDAGVPVAQVRCTVNDHAEASVARAHALLTLPDASVQHASIVG